ELDAADDRRLGGDRRRAGRLPDAVPARQDRHVHPDPSALAGDRRAGLGLPGPVVFRAILYIVRVERRLDGARRRFPGRPGPDPAAREDTPAVPDGGARRRVPAAAPAQSKLVMVLTASARRARSRPNFGGLAQLVRAGVSYAPGPGFESLSRHWEFQK